MLNERWRVVDDTLQWILQVRQGRGTGKATGWKGKRYCQWRTALIRDIGELCGSVESDAMARIEGLPDRHPSVTTTSRIPGLAGGAAP